MRILILAASLLGTTLAHAALDGDVKSAGKKFALRQGPTELATFSTQTECEVSARERTTNPGSIRQRFEIRSGGGALLGSESSQDACIAAVQARLEAAGATTTSGGNVNSCVVSTNFSTTFQPPTCVSTFNFVARYTGVAPEPEPEPPTPCNCPETPIEVGAGEASITWIAPTKNTDGSSLTNLAGYRISYGMSPMTQVHSVQVANPAAIRHKIEDLEPGVYYFSLKAYSTGGRESASSATVSKTVR